MDNHEQPERTSEEETRITRAEPLRVVIARQEFLDELERVSTIPEKEFIGDLELTTWERITLKVDDVIADTLVVAKMTPYILQTVLGLGMRNWKTTVTGVVGALAVLVNSLTGHQIPTEAIVAVVLFVVGFFAKDAGVSGTEK